MVVVLPQGKENFGSALGRALGGGVGEGLANLPDQMRSKKALRQENEALKRMGIDLEGIHNPEVRKQALVSLLQGQQKQNLLNQKMGFFSDKFGGQSPSSMGSNLGLNESVNTNSQVANENPLSWSDKDIAQATLVDQSLGTALRQMKDSAIRQNIASEKERNKKFESERSYQSSYSKSAEENANKLRESIPKKEMALNFARDAIETGNLDFFSKDKLADITGIDAFRSAKGAQLLTAGKENLLSNMSRVSARGQNVWFEQRLNSMFAKIGQSKEANLTVQEMIEGEVALDKAYLEEFDRLSDKDQQEYGFVRKDIEKRARSAIKSKETEIFNRSSYRIKEMEEQEKGVKELKKLVGKNVVKGTPLTTTMAKLYLEKFGDNALDVAKKAGYYIPTFEEFQTFQSRPQEFREGQQE